MLRSKEKEPIRVGPLKLLPLNVRDRKPVSLMHPLALQLAEDEAGIESTVAAMADDWTPRTATQAATQIPVNFTCGPLHRSPDRTLNSPQTAKFPP